MFVHQHIIKYVLAAPRLVHSWQTSACYLFKYDVDNEVPVMFMRILNKQLKVLQLSWCTSILYGDDGFHSGFIQSITITTTWKKIDHSTTVSFYSVQHHFNTRKNISAVKVGTHYLLIVWTRLNIYTSRNSIDFSVYCDDYNNIFVKRTKKQYASMSTIAKYIYTSNLERQRRQAFKTSLEL